MRIPSVLFLLCIGCASMPDAPLEYSRSAVDTSNSGLGAWVSVKFHDNSRFEGELLAIDDEKLYLLPLAAPRWSEIECSRVREVQMVRFGGSVAPALAWTLLGTASTISHGYFLVMSAPIWLVTGAVTSHAALNEAAPTMSVYDDELRLWSRFPQGLPEGFEP